ncbi:hypothetical protein TWF281_010566 [Arthrobotrys megalospora]
MALTVTDRLAKEARDYQNAAATQQYAQTQSQALGSNNSDASRLTERVEPKRAAIALLNDNNLLSFNVMDEDPVPPAASRKDCFRAPALRL